MKTTQKIKAQKEDVFTDVMAATGSPAKAIKASHPEVYEHSPANARNRANRLLKKPEIQTKIQSKLEKMQPKALKAIDRAITSDDENLATNTAKWVVEQVRGKATQRTVNLSATVSIEDYLSQLD